MNRKGLIDTFLEVVPTTIFVFIIIALFVGACVLLAGYRGGGSSSSIKISSNSFLLNNLTVGGKNVLVAEEMIKEQIESKKRISNILFNIEFTNSLSDFMKKDISFNGKQSCLYLAIADPRFVLDGPGVTNNADKSELIIKYGDGSINAGSSLSNSGNEYAISSDYVFVFVNGKEKVLLSYYGLCHGDGSEQIVVGPVRDDVLGNGATISSSGALNSGGQIYFQAVGEAHDLVLKDVQEDSVVVDVESEKQTLEIKSGEERPVDLNKDNLADVFVHVGKVDSAKKEAEISVKSADSGEKNIKFGFDNRFDKNKVILTLMLINGQTENYASIAKHIISIDTNPTQSFDSNNLPSYDIKLFYSDERVGGGGYLTVDLGSYSPSSGKFYINFDRVKVQVEQFSSVLGKVVDPKELIPSKEELAVLSEMLLLECPFAGKRDELFKKGYVTIGCNRVSDYGKMQVEISKSFSDLIKTINYESDRTADVRAQYAKEKESRLRGVAQ